MEKTKSYWIYDNGVAVEHINGVSYWWLNGYRLPTTEVEEWIEENKIDLSTVEGQIAFKLRWM